MYINVAFEGGGIKGLTYVGAIRYLENRGYNIFKASGTSVGALFAALVVAGYNSFEIEKLAEEIDEKTIAIKNSIKGTIREKGLFTIKNLEQKIDEVLTNKGIRTFKDVKFGDDYRLKIVATEVKAKQKIIIPDDLTRLGFDIDSFPIASAVAMSCSLPLYFSLYQINGYSFVDGGMVDNFPFDLIVDNKHPVIGFCLGKDNRKVIKKLQDLNFEQKTESQIYIIYLDSLNIRTSQFKKGLEIRKQLYISGYRSTKLFFERNNA